MEKKIWSRPFALLEKFDVTEYVAACYDYTVQLECAIPGASSSAVQDGTTARHDHGICANVATFDVSGNKGYEVTNGQINTLRPISNIVIGAATDSTSGFSTNIGTNTSMANGYYMATWTSTDLENGTGSYQHYGRAYVTGAIQIEGRPNHS